MKLKDYFDYWDLFFQVWKNSSNNADYYNGMNALPNGWNLTPFNFPYNLLNTPGYPNGSFEYIPEPYWGWTPNSKTELEMVVVNYNPGSGGNAQHRNSTNINQITSSYSSYVQKQLADYISVRDRLIKNRPSQYETTNWHFMNRSKTLHLASTNNLTVDFDKITNYLGIDLVPWHTKNVQSLNGYLQNNFDPIKMWSLQFAIEAAKQTIGALNGKVIVRTNLANFQSIFRNEFASNFFTLGRSSNGTKNANLQEVLIFGEPTVKIYLLWGMRNSLPSADFIRTILA
jgi:hypothetical protein